MVGGAGEPAVVLRRDLRDESETQRSAAAQAQGAALVLALARRPAGAVERQRASLGSYGARARLGASTCRNKASRLCRRRCFGLMSWCVP